MGDTRNVSCLLLTVHTALLEDEYCTFKLSATDSVFNLKEAIHAKWEESHFKPERRIYADDLKLWLLHEPLSTPSTASDLVLLQKQLSEGDLHQIADKLIKPNNTIGEFVSEVGDDTVIRVLVVHPHRAPISGPGPLPENSVLSTPPRQPDGHPRIFPSPPEALTEEDICNYWTGDDDRLNKLMDYAAGRTSLPVWTSEYFPNLRIPSLTDPPQPELLLYRLGDAVLAEKFDSRIQNLFSVERSVTLFINTSGSGKTRLLFEALCRYWGLYFVCQKLLGGTGRTSHVGSLDLSDAMEHLPNRTGFSHEVNSKDVYYYRSNSIAQRSILAVYVARLMVFEKFLDHVPDLSAADAKKQWLLLQIAPHQLIHYDPFMELSVKLRQDSDTNLQLQLEQLWERICRRLNGQTLYTALDEVQAAADILSSSFLASNPQDDDKNLPKRRPVLQQLLLPTRRVNTCQILLGTGVEEDKIMDVVISGAAKEIDFRTYHDTGAFDNKEVQAEYISSLLFPSKVDEKLQERTIQRAWRWLRGRYRFTSSFVQVALRNPLVDYNSLLDIHFHNLTSGVWPTDARDIDQLGSYHGQYSSTLPVISRHAQEALKRNPLLREKILSFIVDFILRGKTKYDGEQQERVIEFGIGHFVQKILTGSDVLIDEPAALVAIQRLLESFEDSMDSGVERKWRSASHMHVMGNVFETMSIFQLYRSLGGGGCRVDSLFEFKGEKPDWSSCNVKLCRVWKDPEDAEDEEVDIDRPGAAIVAYDASSSDEMEAWLEDPKGIPLCSPDHNFGADILALCRIYSPEGVTPHVNFKMLLVGRAKLGDPNNIDLKDALLSIDPDFIYMTKRSSPKPAPWSASSRPGLPQQVHQRLVNLGYDASNKKTTLLVLISPPDIESKWDDKYIPNGRYVALLKQLPLFHKDISYALKHRLETEVEVGHRLSKRPRAV